MKANVSLAIALSVFVVSACANKTPSCTDDQVTARVLQTATDAINNGLLANDPDIHLEKYASRLTMTLEDVTTVEHNKSIDKHTCAANIRLALPPGVAQLQDNRVFQSLTLTSFESDAIGNDIVSPVTYTTYVSEQDGMLIMDTDNVETPGKFVRLAHKTGALDSRLRELNDLRLGLTLYSSDNNNILFEPAGNGRLRFRIEYSNRLCQPWSQTVTREQDDILTYDNREVGCMLTFARLGELMLVERKGCDGMARNCYPDGIYQKR